MAPYLFSSPIHYTTYQKYISIHIIEIICGMAPVLFSNNSDANAEIYPSAIRSSDCVLPSIDGIYFLPRENPTTQIKHLVCEISRSLVDILVHFIRICMRRRRPQKSSHRRATARWENEKRRRTRCKYVFGPAGFLLLLMLISIVPNGMCDVRACVMACVLWARTIQSSPVAQAIRLCHSQLARMNDLNILFHPFHVCMHVEIHLFHRQQKAPLLPCHLFILQQKNNTPTFN